MTDFAVRAVMTGDASSLVGAAKDGAAGLNQLSAAAQSATKAGADLTAAHAAAAGATKLTNIQIQELTYSARHLAEEIAAGVSPTQILFTQITHLSAAFTDLNQVWAVAARVLPFAGMAAGALALGGALAFMTVKAVDFGAATDALNDSLRVHGNMLGLTAEQYTALANAIARTADVSSADAERMVADAVNAGVRSSDDLKKIADSVRGYASATGKDVTQAWGDLLQALADPKKYEQIADAFGIVQKSGEDAADAIDKKFSHIAAPSWLARFEDFFNRFAQFNALAAGGGLAPPVPLPGSGIDVPSSAGFSASELAALRQFHADELAEWQHYYAELADKTQKSIDERIAAEETARRLAGAPFDAVAQTLGVPDLTKGIDSALEKYADADIKAHTLIQQASDAAVKDIGSQFTQLIGGYANAADAAEKWRDDTYKALVAAGEDTQENVAKMQEVFVAKMKAAYDEDLRNRKDWAAGVERANADIAADEQDWAAKSESFIHGFHDTAEQDFVDLVTKGKLQTKSLIDYVLEQFARLAYDKFIAKSVDSLGNSLLNGIADVLGLGSPTAVAESASPHGFGSYHSGGLVGMTMTASRYVNDDVFTSAPRFHSGGLLPGERPIVARDGEGIFTPQQMDTAGDILLAALQRPVVIDLAQAPGAQAAKPTVVVNVHEAPGTKANLKQSTGADGTLQLDVIIDQIDQALASRQARGKSQFGSAVENSYGLRRSPA